MNTHLVYHIEPEATIGGESNCLIVVREIAMERSHDQAYFGRIVETLAHRGSDILPRDIGQVEMLADANGDPIPAPQARYGILDTYTIAIRS